MNQVTPFTNLQQIQSYQFAGSHAFDVYAFKQIELFAQDTKHSVADRAEALRIMQDKGMGCGRSEEISDQDFLNAFLDDCPE